MYLTNREWPSCSYALTTCSYYIFYSYAVSSLPVILAPIEKRRPKPRLSKKYVSGTVTILSSIDNLSGLARPPS
jgi:hypothetical protein